MLFEIFAEVGYEADNFNMDTIELDLGPINGTVKVKLLRKKIKNVYLKVFRSLDVVLSVPEHISDEWIHSFLFSRQKWIDSQITKYKKTGGCGDLPALGDGPSIRFLGRNRRIDKEASFTNRVEVDEEKVYLFVTDITDEALIQNIFRKWWRQTAKAVYQQEVDRFYEAVIRGYGVDKPQIAIRKMKTLWGSCIPSKNKNTLNEYLLKADIRCIQYVVLHELTHLLYPNHGSDFYNFLTVHMPDWKERKKQLDTEVGQGL